MERQRLYPTSPGGARDKNIFVPRNKHPLNQGTGFRLGHPQALYHPADLTSPIVDSLRRLQRRCGFTKSTHQHELPPVWTGSNGADLQLVQSKPPPPRDHEVERICNNCNTSDPANIVLDADKSHFICVQCGAVQSRSNRKSFNRDRACTAEDDKTTRADAFVVPASRFDISFKSVAESRKHSATLVDSSFVSQRAKKRHKLGFAHESTTRAAVLASEARSRMTPKQHTKNSQLIIALERSFDALEPIDAKLKRHLRVEIDRAFRASVLHVHGCCSGCSLNLEERATVGVAVALVNVSLQRLLDGRELVDGLSRAHVMAVRDRTNRCDPSVQSAARSMQASLHTLLDSRSEAVALPACVACSPSTHVSDDVETASPAIKRARSDKQLDAQLPIISGLSIDATSSVSSSSIASTTSTASTASAAAQQPICKSIPLAPSPSPSPNPIPQLSIKRLEASLAKIWTILPSSAETRATASRLITEALFGETMSRVVHTHNVKSTVLLAIFVDVLGQRQGRVSEMPPEIEHLATPKLKEIVLNDLSAFLPSAAQEETTLDFF